MVVGAVALTPALLEAVGSVLVVLAWAIALGLLVVYRSTLGRIALGLASAIEDVGIPTGIRTIHPFGVLADAIRAVDGQIRDGLGLAVASTDRVATTLFHLLTSQIRDVGDAIGGLAHDVSHRFDTVVTRTIPQAARTVERRIGRDLTLTRSLAVATAATVAHDIPALRREVADWKGYTRRMLRRLRRVEKLLAPAAFAAAVAVAIGKLGLNWIRCPALNRINRRHGCAPWRFLELLLAPTVGALVIQNVCQLVKYAEAGAVHVEPYLSELVATGENFVCGGDSGSPSGIVASDRADSTKRPSGWLASDLAGSGV